MIGAVGRPGIAWLTTGQGIGAFSLGGKGALSMSAGLPGARLAIWVVRLTRFCHAQSLRFAKRL
jgi:hypothetical protein